MSCTGQWVITRVAERRAYPFSGQMIDIRVGGETIEATWNHPFLVVRGADLESRKVPMDLPAGEDVSSAHGRWVEAQDIRLGDVLTAISGETLVVAGTSSQYTSGEVYDLAVDELHNHAVGQQGILVHNGKQGVAEEPPSFMADHPFLFFIRDEPTRSILFMGRVVDPTVN